MSDTSEANEVPEGWPEEFNELLFLVRIKPPLEEGLEEFLMKLEGQSGPMEMVMINPRSQDFLDLLEYFDVEEV